MLLGVVDYLSEIIFRLKSVILGGLKLTKYAPKVVLKIHGTSLELVRLAGSCYLLRVPYDKYDTNAPLRTLRCFCGVPEFVGLIRSIWQRIVHRF